MIKISGLNKYFNKGKPNEIHVINDVTLELPERGMVAVFGKSGCGKTTLLNVIGGLDGFSSGDVTLDGNSMKGGSDTLRNKYIGYIFQNYNLNKNVSCFENVADALRLCGMRDEQKITERVMAALANVGLENYHSRTPDTLSGGQQQRVAIARAIVKNPRIILADEPTGNLDDANTVLVMDLLKEISRDHLVVLVTHEANLVDFYCDTVIELRDGRVEEVRSNQAANGYSARGKNDIYLGELDKKQLSDGNAQIEFYGESPDEPIKIKVINNGGRLYLKIDTPKVQVLDAYSEVKLHEGAYEQKQSKIAEKSRIDMSALPAVEGEHFGRLFEMKSAVVSGYAENFKKGKRGKKVLRACLALFAAVVVFMSAVFGTALVGISDTDKSYNHNVFYLYLPDGEHSDKLLAALNSEGSGIDYIRMDYANPNGDLQLKFLTGFFETFSTQSHNEAFLANGVLLGADLVKDSELLAGKKDNLAHNEMVITSRVADTLIENSSLGYIDDYDSLVGLLCEDIAIDGGSAKIAGVVRSNETAAYLDELAMAKYVLANSGLVISLAGDYGIAVENSQIVYAYKDITNSSNENHDAPRVGEVIQISGKDFVISKVVKYADTYEAWLSENKRLNIEENRYSYEYYEKYFSFLDEYIAERELFAGDDDFALWLYAEKGIEEAKYAFTFTGKMSSEEWCYAETQKKLTGSYPAWDSFEGSELQGEFIEKYRNVYIDEFYRSDYSNRYVTSNYFVSEDDYVELSRRTGKTHSSVSGVSYSSGKYYVEEVYSYGEEYAVDIDYSYSERAPYAVIHSNNPSLTTEFLEREFSDIEAPSLYSMALITPEYIYRQTIASYSADIITSIISMAVILVFMSLCMYFIMRSSLMNRIKEVGIYRAIGVSKKNLVFKFLVETLVLTTLTVLVGYLITSAFLGVCLGISPFMETVLYYPVWLAGGVLLVLYAICIFFGTLPIKSLLRKTPSQILSKYDI